MKNAELETALSSIIEERYRNPVDFEFFVAEMLSLGIERFSCDTITNQSSFYTKDRCVCILDRKDLISAQLDGPWPLGEELNGEQVELALKRLDGGEMTCEEFHKEIHAAGVVYCHVYLLQRKIFYMGVNAAYYLESY